MYLRCMRGQTSSVLTQRSTRRCFLTRAWWLRYRATQAGPSRQLERRAVSTSKQQHNGDQSRPKQSAIRPFWVFALCIPFGYALNYARKTQSSNAASTDGFVKYTLVSKQDVSSTSSVFALNPSNASSIIHTDDSAFTRAITSVHFKQPQLQIARSYTLLPALQGQDPTELRFLIRKERNGEVSGYLHGLQLGAEVEVRGVQAEYVVPENVDKVVFLAGGTGVAPAMQIANLVAGEADVHILWANRRREDCAGGKSDTQIAAGAKGQRWDYDLLGRWNPFHSTPNTNTDNNDAHESSAIVSQLNTLKHAHSAPNESAASALRVDYFVDEENTYIQPLMISKLLHQQGPVRAPSEVLAATAPSGATARAPERTNDAGRHLLIVSGPEGFINHWAGPKKWVDGREVQGRLGGVLGQLEAARRWDVVKL